MGWPTAVIAAGVAAIYYFSNPKPQFYYDYTFRVAGRLLNGALGLAEAPPGHLNEFVPFDGAWYSVFPLGSVLTMIPAAALKAIGVINDMPAALIVALLAAGIFYFLLKIGSRYDLPRDRVLLTSLGILFGMWTWTNLTFSGAWQLALGFAMLGELGAIYFTVFDRRPLLAGAFFALGFGNRTEVLLTAPVLILLLGREGRGAFIESAGRGSSDEPPATAGGTDLWSELLEALKGLKGSWRRIAAFCAVPFVLGVSTLAYNHARFGSPVDFGYARIPGVLEEPWYNHGIFSIRYIPRQAWEMLLKPWEFRDAFPYLAPNPFSASILWSSPFILFALRFGTRDKVLKYAAWIEIALMTVLLWMHGNSGGWQFGYRYWMVCLPWLFVILLENAPRKISPIEWAAYVFSFAANAYATWLFNWTNYLRP